MPILDLPPEVISQVYSDWLGIESMVLLDSATTNAASRQKFEADLQSPFSALGVVSQWKECDGYDDVSLPMYEWLLLRGYNTRELFLAGDWWATDDAPELLSTRQLQRMESIRLQSDTTDDCEQERVLMKLLRKCSRLESTSVDLGEEIESILPRILSATPSPVKCLELVNACITSSFARIKRFKQLESLELSNCIVDEFGEEGKGCPFSSLKTCRISAHASEIFGGDMNWILKNSPLLETLDMDCEKFNASQALTVRSVHLKTLNIRIGMQSEANALSHLTDFVRSCASLEDVRIEGHHSAVGAVIEALPCTLRRVVCSTNGLSDTQLVPFVSRQPNLECFTASGSLFEDSFLTAVASGCPLLQGLELTGEVTNAALLFHRGTRLERVSLVYSKITDECVAAMVAFADYLRELSFDGQLLTSEGIRGLQALQHLRKLAVRNYKANAQHWTKLKEARPLLDLQLKY